MINDKFKFNYIIELLIPYTSFFLINYNLLVISDQQIIIPDATLRYRRLLEIIRATLNHKCLQ